MMAYIIRAFLEMFSFNPPYIFPILCPILLVSIVFIFIKHKNSNASLYKLIEKLLLLFVTFIYIMGLMLVTRVAEIPYLIYEASQGLQPIDFFRSAQLIPFGTTIPILQYGMSTVFLGNLVMLVPLGFLIPLWSKSYFNNIYRVGC